MLRLRISADGHERAFVRVRFWRGLLDGFMVGAATMVRHTVVRRILFAILG